ncbi:hypothetical protein [Streptomyces sp. NPDC001978]|uniref:hypothetical protein n=1 Tax=Streptomyces sp. NPDC001978 TaxID=3364627 RepID=UPI0036A1C5F7
MRFLPAGEDRSAAQRVAEQFAPRVTTLLTDMLAEYSRQMRIEADEQHGRAETVTAAPAYDQAGDGPLDDLLRRLLGSDVSWITLRNEPGSAAVIKIAGPKEAVHRACFVIDNFNDGRAFDTMYHANMP